MELSRLYAQLLAAKGKPHLSIDQHRRLFNIISLENRIDELDKAKPMLANHKGRDHFLRVESLKRQLKKLTKSDHAMEVFDDMLRNSEDQGS